ncbi:MAG: HD domain-containing protein [Candidatus Aminicenantes bacterium]|nr:HD domain-containing protein [Candidatus Aminicenantes bacterium]
MNTRQSKPPTALDLRPESLPGRETVGLLRSRFLDYVKGFESPCADIQRNFDIKKEHTERVVSEILGLASDLGLSEREKNLAEIIALFHDIGRFEQFRLHRTFSDRKSENHAVLGLKVLEEERMLEPLDEPVRELIRGAIANHNRPSLPPGLPEPVQFFSRLLRDADKLDIWRVVIAYYHRKEPERNPALELELPDTTGISPGVERALRDGHIVDVRDVRNLNDFKLLQAGWVFDINFEPTLDRVRERRYLERIRDALPESKAVDALFSVIRGFGNDDGAAQLG